MAYNKHVWTSGEVITSALLNNIENEVDAIADLTYTFAGAKKFSSNITVEKVDAGISLKDTDVGGKELLVKSIDGELRVTEVGVGDLVDNLMDVGDLTGNITATQHGTGLGVDKHHNENHGPVQHSDRTHTLFFCGTSWVTDNVMGFNTSVGIGGPELRVDQQDNVARNIFLNSGELFKFEVGRPHFIHLWNNHTASGTVRMVVSYDYFIDAGGTGQSWFTTQTIDIAFTAGTEYQRQQLNNIDMDSMAGRLGAMFIQRDGIHVNDTLAGSIFFLGIEIDMSTDQ